MSLYLRNMHFNNISRYYNFYFEVLSKIIICIVTYKAFNSYGELSWWSLFYFFELHQTVWIQIKLHSLILNYVIGIASEVQYKSRTVENQIWLFIIVWNIKFHWHISLKAISAIDKCEFLFSLLITKWCSTSWRRF